MTAIQTTIIPATDHRPTRIRARAPFEGSDGHRQIIQPIDHTQSMEQNHWMAMQSLCKKYGWPDKNMACGSLGADYVFVFPI